MRALDVKFTVIISVVTLSSAAGLLSWPWWPCSPHARLKNPAWIRTASSQELRDAAHRVLAFPLGDHHDAFAVLEEHGDLSSVPYLRAALARRPTDESRGIECTWSHGARALDRLLTPVKARTP